MTFYEDKPPAYTNDRPGMLKEMRPEIEAEKPSPMRRINFARSELVNADFDLKKALIAWTSDEGRAANDISVNELMRAHLFISEAISALNNAQAHTEE